MEKMKIKEDTVKEYYKIAKKKLKTKFLENDVNILWILKSSTVWKK